MAVSPSIILLPTAYLGCVEYFSRIAVSDIIYIENHENYLKQTCRNRCMILGSNGSIPLIIPVKSGRGSKIPVRDVRISYDLDWQRQHWRTIFSAYGSSPFFQYYSFEMQQFYKDYKWKFLFDLNLELTEKLMTLIGLNSKIQHTVSFENIDESFENLRERFDSCNEKSNPRNDYQPFSYFQVFSHKFGFVPNLSIIDLLFNEGPGTSAILNKGICAPG